MVPHLFHMLFSNLLLLDLKFINSYRCNLNDPCIVSFASRKYFVLLVQYFYSQDIFIAVGERLLLNYFALINLKPKLQLHEVATPSLSVLRLLKGDHQYQIKMRLIWLKSRLLNLYCSHLLLPGCSSNNFL